MVFKKIVMILDLIFYKDLVMYIETIYNLKYKWYKNGGYYEKD